MLTFSLWQILMLYNAKLLIPFFSSMQHGVQLEITNQMYLAKQR